MNNIIFDNNIDYTIYEKQIKYIENFIEWNMNNTTLIFKHGCGYNSLLCNVLIKNNYNYIIYDYFD